MNGVMLGLLPSIISILVSQEFKGLALVKFIIRSNILNNEEFVKKFGTDYLSVLDKATAMRYDINEEQFQKLYDLAEFIKKYVDDNGGRVDLINLDPREIHSGITAYFVVFDLAGDDLARFCKVLSDASAVSFDCTQDEEVCVSITIPNVFVKQK